MSSSDPLNSPKNEALLNAVERVKLLEGEIAFVVRTMQEKVQQLECLTDFSRELSGILQIDQLRAISVQASMRLLGVQKAFLLLWDSERSHLVFESSTSFKLDENTLPGRVGLHQRPEVAISSGENILLAPASNIGLGFQFESILGVPVVSKGVLKGVLLAVDPIQSVKQQKGFGIDEIHLLNSLAHQVAVALENAMLVQDLRESFYGTVEALVEAVEKRDRYTGGHTKRVVHYAMNIGKELGLNEKDLEDLRLGSILHDIGKIGIDDQILRKNAALNSDEFDQMKTHPDLGFDILNRVKGLEGASLSMRFHHERFDGRGYPLGLKGDDIPFNARIVAVADAYDAMVSSRPYRKGLDPKIAYEEIIKHRGTQFDPGAVDGFIAWFKKTKFALVSKS